MDTPAQVVFPKNEFLKLYKRAGTSTVIDLVGDYKGMVLIYDIQIDPIGSKLLHVDFLAVRADEVVTADVPVLLEGESPLVKLGEWRIELVKDTVSVTALPKNLPHEITIDISKILTLQDAVFIRDLQLWDKVVIEEDVDLPLVVAVQVESGEEPVEETTTWTPEEGTTGEAASLSETNTPA